MKSSQLRWQRSLHSSSDDLRGSSAAKSAVQIAVRLMRVRMVWSASCTQPQKGSRQAMLSGQQSGKWAQAMNQHVHNVYPFYTSHPNNKNEAYDLV